MSTGTQLREALHERLRHVDKALVDLNSVLEQGPFEFAIIWPPGEVEASHAASIRDKLRARPLSKDLVKHVQDLFKGLEGGSTIKRAVQTAINAITNAIKKTTELSDELVGNRKELFEGLFNKQPLGANGIPLYGKAPYGLFPAVANVVTAAAPEMGLPDVMGPAQTIMDSLRSAESFMIFSEFAAATIERLNNLADSKA